MAEFRRIAQPDEREPSTTMRALGSAALGLFILTIAAIAISRAAQLADDAAATRAQIETIQPCRPTPARGVAP